MSKPLTSEEIRDRLANRKNYLYQVGVLATERYLETISDYIWENEITDDKKQLKGVTEITREKSYQVNHAKTSKVDGSNRGEELYVLKLYKNRKENDVKKIFGEIIDYQVPLKKERKDAGVGKIDFIYVKDGALYFAEIKAETNKESILKAIVEIQTYYQQANKEKLLKDFGLNLPIKKVVVFFEGSAQANRLNDPNVQKLLRAFDIEAIVLRSDLKIEEVKKA